MSRDPAARTFGDDAHDVWRSLVVAFSLFRWSTLHERYLRFRWLMILASLATFMDAATSFRPLTAGHLLQAGIGLWALGLATLWDPSGTPWWRDPDERAGGDAARWRLRR